MDPIDQSTLDFSQDNLLALNICLAFIMFGVALQLKVQHFRDLFHAPKSLLVGLSSQFILLPILTLILVWIVSPIASIALGLFMIAACPGGNISNFFSALGNANIALSVSLTACATVLAMVMTPINFAFWSNQYEPSRELSTTIKMDHWELVKTIIILLAIPLTAGLFVSERFPKFTEKLHKPVRIVSLAIFAILVTVAVFQNWHLLIEYFDRIFVVVVAHNILAFLLGFFWAKVWKLDGPSTRTLTIETGIQNGGLGLVLIFNFFPELGGMVLVAALWGVWDMFAGLLLGLFWSRKKMSVAS